jgi:hypothetical protein
MKNVLVEFPEVVCRKRTFIRGERRGAVGRTVAARVTRCLDSSAESIACEPAYRCQVAA